MNTPTLLTIVVVHTAAVMAPGSNFLVVARHALGYSRLAGVSAAVGVAVGSFCFIGAGMMGITAVLTQLPWLTDGIRLGGGLFLLYIGYRAMTANPKTADYALPPTTHRQAFLTGLATSLSNPNSALYFLAMFTTTLTTDTPATFRLITAVLMGSISITWYVLLALSFSHQAVRTLYAKIERWGNVVLGILLFLLGLRLILAGLQ